jgi:SAM-dependent methyltransferase
MVYHRESYRKHIDEWARDLADPQRDEIRESWFRDDTVGFWAAWRKYQAVDAFAADPDGVWLTVGDGRYGLDSITLKRKGIKHTIPSDIAEEPLRVARERGLIDAYYVENAEGLSFSDESFDYVFCKESYHHFPRPMIALYEMLRVAREAVVLVEPNDVQRSWLTRVMLAPASMLVDRVLVREAGAVVAPSAGANKEKYDVTADYEPVGNYNYGVSKREMMKVALGLNLPAIAYKGLNDFYVKGCESEPAGWRSKTYRKVRLMILLQDVISRLHVRDWGVLMIIVFKRLPDKDVIQNLRQSRWTFLRLPRNPYAEEHD